MLPLCQRLANHGQVFSGTDAFALAQKGKQLWETMTHVANSTGHWGLFTN